jgi:hypothetical protein
MPENRVVVNPLVQKLSKEKPTTGIAGYIGSIEQGKVRVYRDLSFQAYCDIPQEEVVEFIEGKTPEDCSRLYFRTTATIRITKKSRLGEAVSFDTEATFTVDELKNICRTFRPRPRQSGCKCEGSREGEQQRLHLGGGGIGVGGIGSAGGVLLPPEWCEINCEQWLSICESLSLLEQIWCYADYIECIRGCTSRSGGGGFIG